MTTTKPPRARTVSKADLLATCAGCVWTSSAPNAMGNAARHHDATGHVVTVDVTRTITYGDPNQPLDGQVALEVDA